MSRITHVLDAVWLDVVDKLYDIERDQDEFDHEDFVYRVEDRFGIEMSDDYDRYYEENERG